MANDRIPMSREGYEKRKADLDRMQNVEMIEVTKRIAAARELGDLSENAEYHAAREDQGMLQARIDLRWPFRRAMTNDRPQGTRISAPWSGLCRRQFGSGVQTVRNDF